MGKKTRAIFKEFKDFAFKGNVIDMAVGVMIGGAFGKIVTSVVNDLFMPIISVFTGKISFENLFFAMDGATYPDIASAQAAGAATLNYGMFLSQIMDFLLMAICVFLFVKIVNKLRTIRETPKEAPAESPPQRVCPYCLSAIANEATRCPHCTSMLTKEE